MFTIAFSGGGTGGHIYPGLAVISALQRELDCRVFWVGSSRGIDRSLVEAAGIAFYGIPAGKLRRNFSLRNVSDFFKVAAGFFAAKKILKREKPALLFSKGGFVSVPPCAAAAFLGIPVVTHESDYSPGLATRLNARFAEKSGGRVITAYRETADRFSPGIRKNALVLGNPVRSCFRHGDPEAGRAFLGAGEGDRVLLVLGGSQGARELNRLVEASLPALGSSYLVVHQTGPAHEPAVPNTPRYKTYPYIRDEMPDVLAAAELVLCRSGAGTVWECATAGKPMILLPLAGSGTRGDQVENARFFEKAGAAAVLSPERRRPEDLEALVKLLAADGEKRGAMAEASARIGAEDGAGRIAGFLRETLETMEKSR
ncbi:MAG: undecaprenyldiphospho-muramoylpentapeptide beta-N-acetylglucosaminyltransferase [Spirochaetaceae bacterium]|jgi:UDP-N-acetylglucosamine--N-acetylmuramyl-(pentapeptide) pyrophosphoryl-undecaprenol N-acetylglucosamine transferase|nr:undecaprenyldiphospho-muramoylpentapeptide beta-N-acetylglucosaminyltransferase [Spirochaetaceae bacterium]